MSLYFNSFQRLRWNLGNYDLSQKKNQTSTYTDIIFHDCLKKTRILNKREKTLHHDFVLFIYMYNVSNLNIERVQLK